MDVVAEFQYLVAEGQVGVGLAQLHHPLFVVAERDITVIEVLVDTALELVDELLFSESINLLGYEWLVVAKGCHNTIDKGEPFIVSAHLKLALRANQRFLTISSISSE